MTTPAHVVSHIESTRVVEVLHDRGVRFSPRWLLGSGFVVKANVVITAAHNLGDSHRESGPEGTVVRLLDGRELRVTAVLARSRLIDLALLDVPDLDIVTVKIGRLNREGIDVVDDVMAVGFPNYKYADDRPISTKRQPAQPFGSIPTVEDLTAGQLSIKLLGGEPARQEDGGESPWAGLSGGAVIVRDHLVGVVIEHHSAEGLGSLRVVPVTAVSTLPPKERGLFLAILGIADTQKLPVINEVERSLLSPEASDLVRTLEELTELSSAGLLDAGAVRALRIRAYKEAKGWK